MKNENWNSRKGFILAAAGSAVGLANIWKFPNEAFEGGGSFVVIYIISLLILGLPVLLCEISIGMISKTRVFKAFEKLENKSWGVFGYFAMMTGFLLLSFYAVVGGWCFYYCISYLLDLFNLTAPIDFSVLTTSVWYQLLSTLAFLICTIIIVRKGVAKGIERTINWLMFSLCALLLVFAILAIQKTGLELPINYLLDFDSFNISNDLILSAIGHSFFTLSVGVGVMLVFSSYLKKQNGIIQSSLLIVAIDTIIAFTAFFIVVPIILYLQEHNIEFDADEGRLFEVIPYLLDSLDYGKALGFLFYLLLSIAAITSSISILELLVSGYSNKFDDRISRRKSTFIVGSILCIVASFTSLSLGAIESLTNLGLFSSMVTIVSKYLLTIGGFLICIFVGWFVKEKHKRLVIKNNNLYGFWNFIIKYIAPLIILGVMIGKLL